MVDPGRGTVTSRYCGEAEIMGASPVTGNDGTVYVASLDGYITALRGTCEPGCVHGTCNTSTGVCHCRAPYKGISCKELCPKSCSGHGICHPNATCECAGLYRGEDCSTLGCLKDCLGRGACVQGRCGCGEWHEGGDCGESKLWNLFHRHMGAIVTVLAVAVGLLLRLQGGDPAYGTSRRARFRREYTSRQPEKALGGLHNFGIYATNRFERAVRVTSGSPSKFMLRQRRPHQPGGLIGGL